MSFEAFEVHLYPMAGSKLCSGNDLAALDDVLCDIQTEWPEFHPDGVSMARLYEPLPPNERLFVCESSAGVIQLSARLNTDDGSVVFSLRFAYCNSRSVDELFCGMVLWLMQRFQLGCHVAADLAPQQEGESDEVAEKVRSLLLPSMDYNRRLWQLNAGTSDEAALRPGDAVARYIVPQPLVAAAAKPIGTSAEDGTMVYERSRDRDSNHASPHART